MKTISSKQDLLQSLKEVLKIEIEARNRYVEDINTFTDFEITNTITKIKMDENTHITLLEELIKMLA